jgi:hypothetical protein
VTQFLLLLSRYFSWLAPLVGKWAWWLAEGNSEVVDEGYKVLNFDCLVSVFARYNSCQFPQYALEWAIDAEEAKPCLAAMKVWLEKEAADPNGLRVHFPIEIRWSAADDIFLSPAYGRETCWIGVVTYRYVHLSPSAYVQTIRFTGPVSQIPRTLCRVARIVRRTTTLGQAAWPGSKTARGFVPRVFRVQKRDPSRRPRWDHAQ